MAPASLRRVPWSRFPCFLSVRALRLPGHRPRLAPFPSRAVTTHRAEQPGPPRFLGYPCTRAPFFDPGAAACAVLPSAFLTASACHVWFSGLDRAARVLAVYASQPGLPSVAAQDSLPAASFGPWPDGDFRPAGFHVRFQPVGFRSWRSPHLRLCLAHQEVRKGGRPEHAPTLTASDLPPFLCILNRTALALDPVCASPRHDSLKTRKPASRAPCDTQLRAFIWIACCACSYPA